MIPTLLGTNTSTGLDTVLGIDGPGWLLCVECCVESVPVPGDTMRERQDRLLEHAVAVSGTKERPAAGQGTPEGRRLGKGRPTIIQSVDMETLNSGWGGGDQGRLLGAGGRKVEVGTGAQHAQRCDSPDPGWLWKALDARLWQGLGLPPHTHAPFLRQ